MPKKYALIAFLILLAGIRVAKGQSQELLYGKNNGTSLRPLASANIWVQSVSSGGGYYSNGVLNISYNIGDPIFYGDSSANKFGDFYIFQGFEQPDRFDNFDVKGGIEGDYTIKYGPNPFVGDFHIYIYPAPGSPTLDDELFVITIVDVLGQKMVLQATENKVFGKNDRENIVLDLSPLHADQIYYITINGVNSGFIKTIKVVKIDNN